MIGQFGLKATKTKNVDERYDEFMTIINRNLVFKRKKNIKKPLMKEKPLWDSKKIFTRNRSIENENAYKNVNVYSI